MLGARVADPEGVESDAGAAGEVDGLGLLPVVTRFAREKSLGRPAGSWRGHAVRAYEIHHGRATRAGADEAETFLDGWRAGPVWGTVWHGAFENDAFRRAWLTEVAAGAGSSWTPTPGAPAYGARREAMIDALADAVEEHLDVDLLLAGTRVTSTAGAVRVTVRVLVVGIGSGHPGHLTGDAVAALNAVDVFLVADKRAATRDLVTLRAELCAAVITHDRYRFVEVADPERGPDAERDSTAYAGAVRDWHAERARRHADAITAEVGGSGTVGLLVWGDPSLYDSTLRVVETIGELLRAEGVDLEVEVVPGLSSVSLLAARHRVALNRVGRPVHITTGRRLRDEYDPALGDVVVMLDGDLACGGLVEAHPDLEIFWGAQLGLADEALVHGRLGAVLPEIRARRDAVRAARGWVMDTYLLRPGPGR